MANNNESSKKKLIINYLPQTLNDKQFYDIFSTVGAVESCRIMRDHRTGYSYGYGFVTYIEEEDANRAIGTLNGLNIQDKRLKVSYARPPGDEIKDTNLYVTNLPKNFQDQDIEELFGPYGTIVQHNILKDKITGIPRGVAFVRFDKKEEAQEAMASLNGSHLEGSLLPLQIKLAEEHGKQKAAYFAGFQTGMAIKQRMGFLPSASNFQQRGRGSQHFRFNPMGRGGSNFQM